VNERATSAVGSLSPFGKRVGVKGLPAVPMDPNSLTHSSLLQTRSSTLAGEGTSGDSAPADLTQ